MSSTINLCTQSTGQEDDWKDLYELAFPQDERMPVADVRKMLAAGTMLLHKTTNSAGELLCFSIVNPLSNFALLGYIATDSTKRSSGVGSKHMKRLIEILKKQFPTHIGLFLEIESTKEPNLPVEEQKARQRRLAFYQRLGCKRLCKKYLMPTYTPGGQPRLGELLWSEFTNVNESDLPAVITEIYQKAYNLPATDPTVQHVLGQFATTNAGSTVLCTTVDNSGGSSNSGTSTSSNASTAGDTTSTSAPATVTAPAADSGSNPGVDTSANTGSGVQNPASVPAAPSKPAETSEPAKPADEAQKAGDVK